VIGGEGDWTQRDDNKEILGLFHTDKKEYKIFLIDKENRNGEVAKTCMQMPPHIRGKICAFPQYIWKPFLIYMTLQLLHFEFPYI
jgi:hypothetical protein